MATTVAAMGRKDIVRRIRTFRKFKLDFTDSYLSNLSTDKLRHILLAAMMTTSR